MSGCANKYNKHFRPDSGKRDSPGPQNNSPSTQQVDRVGLNPPNVPVQGDPEAANNGTKNCLQKYKKYAYLGCIGLVIILIVVLIILAATGAFNVGSS